MQLLDGSLVLSASDLTAFLDCQHLTQLDLSVAEGSTVAPHLKDPELDVIRRRGTEHEQHAVQQYRDANLIVAEITHRAATASAYNLAQQQTLEAMRRGVDVIYQATFFNGIWLGFADFLEKVPGASALGDFRYEVVDTKLARHAKVAALVQTTLYSWFLTPLQGVQPQNMHLVLGSGLRHDFRVSDYLAYVDLARARIQDACLRRPQTYPEPVDHCAVCRWREICASRWVADDHLTLIAGLRTDQAERLGLANLSTVAKLAAAPDGLTVSGISPGPLLRLQNQARLQVQGRTEGRLIYKFLPGAPGLAELPEPTDGDLFLDIEGDPFVDGGLEYLFGVAELTSGGSDYRAYWAHSRDEEGVAFRSVINHIIGCLDRNPSIHVFHYAPYEATAIRRLMGIHGSEIEVDHLLRGGVLVDLYQLVRRAVQTSQDSYGLKAIERFYQPPRSGQLKDAGSSIVAYETWIADRQQSMLDDIESYNRDDCLSTVALRQWLESLRLEYETETGAPLERPASRTGKPEPEQERRDMETTRLYERLMADVPAKPLDRTEAQEAQWALGQALWFHRREQKSEWWSYFERLEMTDLELIEDPEALGQLTYLGPVGQVKRSIVHRYEYPEQEHKILIGSSPVDPVTGRPAGLVEDVNVIGRWIDLRRGLESEVPHPIALVPQPPPNALPLRSAIARVAEWVVANGVEGRGSYRAVRELLLGRPRLPAISATTANEAAVDIVMQLDETCLGIQGPPGSGKTTTGAQMVLRLARQGRAVGLTALSHRVIGHFLEAVSEQAREKGFYLRAIQKAEPEEFCGVPEVRRCSTNSEVAAALRDGAVDVVAGTAWLFADPTLSGLIDTLFIDEAGQVPLANVVAISGASTNIVLLGDPNQLAQPMRGAHPEGAAPSSLQQLLGGAITMPRDRGLFLDRSWRMHPLICNFVSEIAYEGRLTSAPGRDRLQVDGIAGLRLVRVEHLGNRTHSVEEAEVVKQIVESLIGLEWTDTTGFARRLRLEDILILAPYNSQVGVLGRVIPGARVGTVDKFQGQEAPVALYSMATSTPDDVPHGVDFLYSLNRLNVAISRAQALSIVVFSPKLLLLRPSDPQRLRLANALCRLSVDAAPLALAQA